MSDDAPLSSVQIAVAYHERTRHLPGSYARSLGFMDWDSQPDPFRRFDGAPLVPLSLVPLGDEPRYEPAFVPGHVAPAALDARAVSQLLFDSLALSAWKQAGSSRWSLRVNPSSGNLHPTEGYVVTGPIAGLTDAPAVLHYAPHEHALERRRELSPEAWAAIAAQLPAGSILVGLTSIHWREAWKYGERAFRYCQHDVGHAIAAIAVAAAGLGWEARVLETVLDPELAALLGTDVQSGPEAEEPDALIVLFPSTSELPVEKWRAFDLPAAAFAGPPPSGTPRALSAYQHDWPVIDQVAHATRKTAPPSGDFFAPPDFDNAALTVGDSPLALRRIVHARRSAVAFDGRTGISRDALFQILIKTMPGARQVPFATLPFHPSIDLLLFVHRVAGVTPGLYALCRDPARMPALREALDPKFEWRTPEGCPPSLPLYLLEAGDARQAAVQTSCGQDIAGAGAVAFAMLADFLAPLERHGAWMYRRLFWEAGLVGQVLYLEAEASGIRGTGIGCYFDDLTHGIFGLRDAGRRVLYHFTIGGPVEDSRIQTQPPYAHLSRSEPVD